MIFHNTYIAPWALPNEVIPFHCVWEPEEKLSKICFQFPEDYELIDTLNFTKYECDHSNRLISINISDLKSNNYFGAVISYVKICDEIERKDDVEVKFLNNKEIISIKKFNTRVVRPKIIIEKIEKPIRIDDKSNLNKLINLNVTHKGFGTANIDIQVTERDKNISKYSSIYFDMIKKIFEEISEKLSDLDDAFDDNISLNKDMMKKIADSFLDITNEKDNPFGLSEEEINEAKEIIRDKAQQEIAYRVFLKNLSTIFLSALLYYNDRHPDDSIRLLYGNMAADITGKIEELDVTITYFDSQYNEYPKENTKIMILDNRSPENMIDTISIPINIVWKKELLEL